MNAEQNTISVQLMVDMNNLIEMKVLNPETESVVLISN